VYWLWKPFQRIPFFHIGSLYFKEDVSEEIQTLPLFSENKDATLHNSQGDIV
jgi:hypothetical protein